MTNMRLRLFAAAALILGIFSSAMAGRVVRVTASTDMSSVLLNTGDTLIVTLRVHSGTDYKWVLMSSDDSMLRFNQSNDPSGGGTPGGWATQQFQFTAMRAGTTVANFSLLNQSSGSQASPKTFVLTASISDPAPPPSGNVVLTDRNNGNQQVRFYQGQTVEVRLSSNPSTGYNWVPTNVPNELLEQMGNRQYIPGNSGLMGSGGTTVFRYRVIASGGGILSYSNQRSNGDVAQNWQVIFSIPRP